MIKLHILVLDGIPKPVFAMEFHRLRNLSQLSIYSGIHVIANESFAALEGTSIEQLTIANSDQLISIEPMSFAHLRKLKTLKLEHNSNIRLTNARVAFYGLRYTSIRGLSLEGVEPPEGKNVVLDKEFFKDLKQTKLISITLSSNNIAKIERGWSEYLPYMRHIQMSHNRLTNLMESMADCAKLKFLESVDVSDQLCPKLEEKSSIYHTNISADKRTVDIAVSSGQDEPQNCVLFRRHACQNNSLSITTSADAPGNLRNGRSFTPVCFNVPASLKKLNVHNSFQLYKNTLPPLVIDGASRLKTFLFAWSGLEAINGPVIFTDPVKSIDVDLSNNMISCIAVGLLKISAMNGSTIHSLDLHANRLSTQLSRDKDGKVFQHFTGLAILDLSKNGIKTLPRKIFSQLSDIEELYLSGNSLRRVRFDFSHMKKLRKMDLSYNLIVTMTQQTMENFTDVFQRSKMTIKLEGNPIQCSCDSIQYLHWLNSSRKRIDGFKTTTCQFRGDDVRFEFLDTHILQELDFECSKWIASVVAGTLTGFALLIVALSVCCYRHRWEIRYACLKFTQRGQRYQQIVDEPISYEYDAFVVYDSEDRDWVNEELIPRWELPERVEEHIDLTGEHEETHVLLEEQPHVRIPKLCVHERDFAPGEEIIGNIWHKMERSRKVILVISRNFVTSKYCNYEMNLARLRSVEKGRNVIVPVLLEMPDVHMVSETLEWVLRKLTYIEWPTHEGEREDFWQNMRRALDTNEE